ncbi:uroporphyrinogen-III synthase [Microvirga antarctica]|uniref:uroporphyrinogen-III synthase n=1 Tax=Microvirga antarctica TaxID=2819233 RepID=UPI001B3176B4|nr:uroporphyrinogen-III synthase [Microvirga antarctica]
MRVLVTRAPDDAVRTASRLVARGHEALIASVTDIVLTDLPPPVGGWDAILLTSAHAAPALETLADRAVPVFAVGERSADAARASGFSDIRVAAGDATALARLVQRDSPAGAALLHVTGRHRKDEPAASLTAAGFTVVAWEAYEARALDRLPVVATQALAAGRIDAALHYSRRSVGLLLELAGGADVLSRLSALPHFCLSDDVAEPLKSLGFQVRVAAAPDEGSLLASLDD